MSTIAELLERIDEYAEARERVGRADDDDQPALRAELDRACHAWGQLIEARKSFSAG